MKTIEEVLVEYNIVLEYGGGRLPNGRQIRYLKDLGRIDIGDKDFDRWANSIEMSFDVRSTKGLRAFMRYLDTE